MNKNLCSVVVPVLNMNMALSAKESYRGFRLLLANQGWENIFKVTNHGINFKLFRLMLRSTCAIVLETSVTRRTLPPVVPELGGFQSDLGALCHRSSI